MKKAEENVLRVALLPRVSTEEQVLRGFSLDAQEKALVEYANNNNMKIVGIYRDEGHSARKPVLKRPVMLELLEDVKAGKIDRILFIKLDRWFRNVSEYHSIQRILDKHNVTWQAILEDYNTTTADGRLKVNIMLSVAENEADRTSERIKFVFDAKKEKKEVFFNLPFGYKAEMIDGVRKAVKDPETQHILEYFFHKALTTSVRKAALEVNKEFDLNYPYKFWYRFTRSELFAGYYQGIEDYVPAYITKAEFDDLNNKGKIVKKAQNNRIYLFTGLMMCPKCGRRLGAKYSRSGNGREYLFYRCQHRIAGLCDFVSISEVNIEKYLLENLRKEMERFVLDNEAEKQPEKKYKPRENEIEKLQEKLRRVNVAFFAANMTDEEYAKQTAAIKSEIAIAEQAAARAERPIDLEAIKAFLATDFEGIYVTLTKEEKRTMWRAVVDEIILDDGKPVEIKLKA